MSMFAEERKNYRIRYNKPDGSEYLFSFQNIKLDHRVNQYDKAKFWADPENYGEVPLKPEDVEGEEPEILVERRTGEDTWTTEFRGYAKKGGNINEDGEMNVKLYGFGKKHGTAKINLTNVSGTLPEVVEEGLPDGYAVSTPDDVEHPTLQSYSINDQRQRMWKELSRDFDYRIDFVHRQSNGDWVVRVEPIGYGSVKDTLASRTSYSDGDTLATFKEWTPETTEGLLNHVEVYNEVGGDVVEAAVKDEDSIEEYNEEVYDSFHVDYISTVGEAETVADSLIQSVGDEGGTTNQKIYHDNVVNRVFVLDDNQRSVDGEYLCRKQENYIPDYNCDLTFNLKDIGMQSRGSEKEDIRRSANRVSVDEQENVGEQGLDNADTGSAESDTGTSGGVDDGESDTGTSGGVDDGDSNTGTSGGVDDGESDTGITGNVGNAGGSSIIAEDDTGLTAGDTLSSDSWETLENFEAPDEDVAGIEIMTSIYIDTANSTGDVMFYRVYNASQDEYYPSTDGKRLVASTEEFNLTPSMFIPANVGQAIGGDILEVQWKMSSHTSSADYVVNWHTIGEHSHPDTMNTEDFDHPHGDDISTTDFSHGHTDSISTVDNVHGHSDDIGTVDNPHGGSDDASSHGVEGSTDPKEVDISKTNKKDRED